jgi:hypothetical protein
MGSWNWEYEKDGLQLEMVGGAGAIAADHELK